MIVSERKLLTGSRTTAFLDVKSLYSMIPREKRMHMHRVSLYAQTLFLASKERGLWDEEFPEDILDYSEKIFELHDIGRYYISSELHNKVEALSEEEMAEIKRHTVYALKVQECVYMPILPNDMLPYFRGVATMHHERYDGKGYPYGKRGKAIPLMARVCAIADAYDGMVSWKTYREALSREQAFEVLKKEAGTQFQPELVECFLSITEQIEKIDLAVNNR